MEESSDPQPAGLEAAGAGRSGAAAPERVAISLLGGDWTEENLFHYVLVQIRMELYLY